MKKVGNRFCLVSRVEDSTSQTQARLLKRFDSDDLAETVEKCWVEIDLVSVGGVGSILACS